MVRVNTANQRFDLAIAHDALWAPVVGACAIVVAPPADHPVFAARATTGTGPPKRRRGWRAAASSILRWVGTRRAHVSAREPKRAHASAR